MSYEKMFCKNCARENPATKMFKVELTNKKFVWMCESCNMNREYGKDDVPRSNNEKRLFDEGEID